MIVAVVGLGYVGLPLAMAYADAGAKVIGIDVDEDRVESLKRGESYVSDVGNMSLLHNMKDLYFTTAYEHIGKADAIFVCVPTPFDKQKHPDTSYIRSAGQSIGNHVRENQVVILESTSWPGTTAEVFWDAMSEGMPSLWEMAPPIVAFSSERINPGSEIHITQIPKVVGLYGDRADREKVLDILRFAGFTPHLVSSPEVAEMSKLLENTFRAVNIALVNEVAMLCEKMNLDVWEVIEAAATKPYGFMPFYPGPGVGGHCIPIDPYYLHAKALEYNVHMRSIETAMAINEGMPQYVADLVMREAAYRKLDTEKIVLLGSSYKPNTNDTRGAPSAEISLLLDAVICDDPDIGIMSHTDIAVVLVKSTDYNYQYLLDNVPLVVDCCNAMPGMSTTDNSIVRLGVGDKILW